MFDGEDPAAGEKLRVLVKSAPVSSVAAGMPAWRNWLARSRCAQRTRR